MARITIPIDKKIGKAKEDAAQARDHYDEALETLKKLLVKKDEVKKAELNSVIDDCGIRFDKIINRLKRKDQLRSGEGK